MSVHDTTTGTNPLVIWLVVLGVVVVGLGGWVVYDEFFAADMPPPEAEALVEAYTEAWHDHDGKAFRALVTDDYAFENPGGVFGASSQAQAISWGSERFSVEVLGSPIWAGDDSTWFTSRANLVRAPGYPDEGVRGISVIEVVETGAGWRVARHIWMADS